MFLWSFSFCGFKNFNHVIKGAISGTRIQNCFFQNCLCGLDIAGADCIIENNYMSGSNWHSGKNYNTASNNSDSAGALTFAMKCGSLRLSRIRNNFITGWPQMHLYCYGSNEGTIFDSNWFDICDLSGLVLENSRGGTFVNNTFNRCMIGNCAPAPGLPGSGSQVDSSAAKLDDDVSSTDFNAIVRIKNSHNLNFSNNMFGYIDHGVPSPMPATFRISGTADLTKNIHINNSMYLDYAASPYDQIIIVDSGATAPIET